MQMLRAYHRYATLVIAVFTLFLGVTGTIIQTVDLKSILTEVPADDPDIRAMRESFDGPPDYQVRETRDYLAKALPANSDYPSMLDATLAAARKQLGAVPLKYLEFRMSGDKPVGQVGVEQGHASFDLASGTLLERTDSDKVDVAPRVSTRNTFKRLHRMTTFGDWALVINLIVAIGLPVLIVTGVWIYFKLLLARKKIKRDSLFWSGGGQWRQLHRWVSIVSAVFLLCVTFSGGWLAIESAGLAIYFHNHGPPSGAGGGGRPGGPQRRPDHSTPLVDAELAQMLNKTLGAAALSAPGDPIKVVRLRYYAGYPQGIVVTGGENSQQLVYNTRTGAAMSETEPGYPETPFPFGWQAHQFAKSLHRGDIIGIPGRLMSLFAGLAMVFLSVSGIWMYWQMWKIRRESGRKALVWK